MVETRRGSSSSKRPLPSSPPPSSSKRSKIQAASTGAASAEASSPLKDASMELPVETLSPVNESLSSPREPELQSSDPLLTVTPEPISADTERSPGIESDGLLSPQPLGESSIAGGLHREKKRPTKSAPAKPVPAKAGKPLDKHAHAWGKLLSQCSQWLRRGNLEYSDADINEIRIDFAKYFMKRHSS